MPLAKFGHTFLKENAGVPISEEKDKIVQCLRANQKDTRFEPKSESIIDEGKHFFGWGLVLE